MTFLAEVGRLSAAVDGTFGEDFAYQPFAGAYDTSAPETLDASRPAATLRALFVEREAKPATHAFDAHQRNRPGVETGSPVIEISLGEQWRQAEAGTPLKIKAGDRFTRLLTGAVYRAVSIEPATPTGLVKIKVNQL